MTIKGFLGIDAGTQGLSVVFCDETLNVIATGEGGYDMLPDLAEGCYLQNPGDWESALSNAMEDLRETMRGTNHAEFEVLAIGISGQMHGEVLADESGNSLGPARLWCDARNEAQGAELTERFGVKMPKRITAARWLWTIRNHKVLAAKTARITTPAGWIALRLSGQWNLGIGDAAGMFPIDQQTLEFDARLLRSFNDLTKSENVKPIGELLPDVQRAGQDGGVLNAEGAKLLGLDRGIPVAPAEGDQPAALAGSLIGRAGTVSCSFGTSVCANSVGDRTFNGVSNSVDHFCAPDGMPINMVWLRNGTTFMNSVVKMFVDANKGSFADVISKALDADADCGGLIALPFMDDEPGLSVMRGGTAMLVGLNSENATAGNAVKTALLATIFNLRIGSEVLDAQGFPRTEIVLSGGLTRTPELARILADVFRTPVTLPAGAEEGTAVGAAILARFRYDWIAGKRRDWPDFLDSLGGDAGMRFEPEEENAVHYDTLFVKYKRLMAIHGELDAALSE